MVERIIALRSVGTENYFGSLAGMQYYFWAFGWDGVVIVWDLFQGRYVEM